MSDEFYRRYWKAFAESEAGPNTHTSDIPTQKNGQECYRKFEKRWPHNFMLVATANIRLDRLGAEFFTGSRKQGHAFIRQLDPLSSGRVSLQNGAVADTHFNKTDGKIELLWTDARLNDEAFWPVHFLWLRIALHQLAETLGPRADAFIMDQA